MRLLYMEKSLNIFSPRCSNSDFMLAERFLVKYLSTFDEIQQDCRDSKPLMQNERKSDFSKLLLLRSLIC